MRIATEKDWPFIETVAEIKRNPEYDKCWQLVNDYGVFFFDPITPNFSIVEVHMAFHPEGRGKFAMQACREAIELCWERGIVHIIGRVPVEDRPARLMTRMVGFHSLGIALRNPGGPMVEWFELRRDQCHLLQ